MGLLRLSDVSVIKWSSPEDLIYTNDWSVPKGELKDPRIWARLKLRALEAVPGAVVISGLHLSPTDL